MINSRFNNGNFRTGTVFTDKIRGKQISTFINIPAQDVPAGNVRNFPVHHRDQDRPENRGYHWLRVDLWVRVDPELPAVHCHRLCHWDRVDQVGRVDPVVQVGQAVRLVVVRLARGYPAHRAVPVVPDCHSGQADLVDRVVRQGPICRHSHWDRDFRATRLDRVDQVARLVLVGLDTGIGVALGAFDP